MEAHITLNNYNTMLLIFPHSTQFVMQHRGWLFLGQDFTLKAKAQINSTKNTNYSMPCISKTKEWKCKFYK